MTNYQTKIIVASCTDTLEEEVNRFLKGFDHQNIESVKFHFDTKYSQHKATIVYIG